jgi:hypothetical protein
MTAIDEKQLCQKHRVVRSRDLKLKKSPLSLRMEKPAKVCLPGQALHQFKILPLGQARLEFFFDPPGLGAAVGQ